MNDQDKLEELQTNLARDLVYIEVNKSVTKDQLEEINDVYSKVYNMVTEIKSL